LVFTVGDSPVERVEAGPVLFGQPSWTHVYAIAGVREIEPFSLDDLIADAGTRGSDVRDRYRGQTQHHRIIRTIHEEDAPLFLGRMRPRRGTWSATEALARNQHESERRAAAELDADQLLRALKKLDRENRQQGQGRQYRRGKSQKRNVRFVELLKALYDDRCQVCGDRIEGPDGRSRADVHHFEPRDGDRSDRLANVIVVCPNAHARFELGAFRWTNAGLEAWESGQWRRRALAVDRHLLRPL
jgi:hypothetical protein